MIVSDDSICSSKIDDGILLAWVLDIPVSNVKSILTAPVGTHVLFLESYFLDIFPDVSTLVMFLLSDQLYKNYQLEHVTLTTNKQPSLNHMVKVVMSGKIFIVKINPQHGLTEYIIKPLCNILNQTFNPIIQRLTDTNRRSFESLKAD